jgi:hypothetical protein
MYYLNIYILYIYIYILDFGRYVRYCAGPFPYSDHTWVTNDLNDLMKRRKFKVMNENKVWEFGSVLRWSEYNMGPGDSQLKFTLFGCMVDNNNNNNNNNNEDDDDDDTNKKEATTTVRSFVVVRMNVHGGGTVYSKSTNSDRCVDSEKGKELLSLEWIDPIVLLQEKEKDNDNDDEIGGSLCYYFDANDKNRPIEMYKPIDKERLQLMRNDIVLKYGNGMVDKGLPQELVQSFLAKLTSEEVLIDNDQTYYYEFRLLCLSLPFVFLVEIITRIILKQECVCGYTKVLKDDGSDSSSKIQKCRFIQIVVESVVVLQDDEEWMEQSIDLDPMRNTDFGYDSTGTKIDVTPRDMIQIRFYGIVNKLGEVSENFLYVVVKLGVVSSHQTSDHDFFLFTFYFQWFEMQEEYRAAIWTYQHNVHCLSDPNYFLKDPIDNPDRIPTLTSKDSNKFYCLSYIALANKRVGDFASAYKYYQYCIGMTITDRVNPLSISNNLNIFKQDAKYWIGSTGKLTPWKNANANADGVGHSGGSSNDDDNQNNNNNNGSSSTTTSTIQKCFVCQKESNVHACSACHSVSYCGRECQKKAWKRHKLICFGR